MFQNVSESYNVTQASSEIAIIFLVTFFLGAMLAWLIKPSGVVASKEKNTRSSAPILSADDDLQLIEGIGPAIEKLCKKHGIVSYLDIINADVPGLEEVLEQGGTRFKRHIPTTWPDQARLAHEGKWTELEEYQEILNTKK